MHLKNRIEVNQEFRIELKNRISDIKQTKNELKKLKDISDEVNLADGNNLLGDRFEHLINSLEEILIDDVDSLRCWLLYVNDELDSVNRRISYEN